MRESMKMQGGRVQRGRSMRLSRGFTLVEVLMAVGLGSVILASGSRFVSDRVDDIKDQATAQYQKQFAVASDRFVKDNLATIAGGLTVNGPPTAIPLPTIRSAGYLPSGLVATNPYRQTPCLVVRRVADSATGTPRLEALVTTEGGLSIPEARVPFVAAQGGAYGGFVPASAPTTAQGAYGVWTTPLAGFNGASCSGLSVSANHLAYALFFDGAGDINTDELLHRNVVAGRPDLNTMNTALNMGGFDVVNALNVNATNNVNAGADVVAGGRVMATSDDPVYGQTELRRWGLNNPSGFIYIEPMAGNGVVIMPSGGGTSGSFVSSMSNNEFRQGHTQFSRENQTFCCGDAGTIGVAEATASTGRTASINFHNAGRSEGTLELANDSVERRLRVFGNSGVPVGLQAGSLRSDTFTTTAGETYTGGWFRTTGTGGWYSEPFNGGWFMNDGSWVRSYADKGVYTGGEIQGGGIRGNGYVTSGNWIHANGGISAGSDISTTGGIHITNTNSWSFIGRDGWGGDFTAAQNPVGSAYVNDIFIRSIGRWASQIGGGTNNYVATYSNYSQVGWGFNGSGRTQMIMAYGGKNESLAPGDPDSNTCDLVGQVNTVGTVAANGDNYFNFAKICSISFVVPPGASWTVTSNPYPTNTGLIRAFVYEF